MQALPKTNKGYVSLGNMPAMVLTLVVIVVILSVGAMIIGEVRDQTAANTVERNVTIEGLDAFQTIAEWLPIIGIVLAAAVIIGLVVWFGMKGGT